MAGGARREPAHPARPRMMARPSTTLGPSCCGRRCAERPRRARHTASMVSERRDPPTTPLPRATPRYSMICSGWSALYGGKTGFDDCRRSPFDAGGEPCAGCERRFDLSRLPGYDTTRPEGGGGDAAMDGRSLECSCHRASLRAHGSRRHRGGARKGSPVTWLRSLRGCIHFGCYRGIQHCSAWLDPPWGRLGHLGC